MSSNTAISENLTYDLSIVSPVYNEERGIRSFCDRLHAVLLKTGMTFEIILVDDGSQDHSFLEMKSVRVHIPTLKIVRLSRNFGHQLALTAGLELAKGKAVIVMDSDLQDPPEVIPQMIEKWQEGFEIVHGVRSQRKGETWFKKITAYLFYRLLCLSTKIEISKDAGDFYLLDQKVVAVLNELEERHRFIRGLLAWVGFKRAFVSYVREPRFAGKTKYGLWKMIRFSIDAATSFSFAPLRLISVIGFFISLLAFLGILVIFYIRLFTNVTVTGWSSLMVVVLFIGGIQLIAMGIIGEYLARIGDDVKRRPLFVIKETIG